MKVGLIKNKTLSLALADKSNDEKSSEKKYNINYSPLFNNDTNNRFGIIFDLDLETLDCELSIKFISVFETDDPFEEDFLDSPFLRINAPAIGFPYLRAYVSNLLLSSGYEPANLPTINFVAMDKFKRSEEEKGEQNKDDE